MSCGSTPLRIPCRDSRIERFRPAIDGVLLVATLVPFALAIPMAISQIRGDELKAQKEVVRITGIQWSGHKQAKRATMQEERRSKKARNVTRFLSRNTSRQSQQDGAEAAGSLDSLISGSTVGSPAGGCTVGARGAARAAPSSADECASLCVDAQPSCAGGPSSDTAEVGSEDPLVSALPPEEGRGGASPIGDDAVCAAGDPTSVTAQAGGAAPREPSAAADAARAAGRSRDAKETVAAKPGIVTPPPGSPQRGKSVLDEIRESVVGFFTPLVARGSGGAAMPGPTSTTKQERDGSVRV